MRKYEAKIMAGGRGAKGIYTMAFLLDRPIEDFVPGQFCHVRVPGSGELLLRRPFGIASCNGTDRLSIAFKVVGEGTKRLAEAAEAAQRGMNITTDILAPLGNGFPKLKGSVWLVGGGMGCAPLLSFRETEETRYTAFLGHRSADEVYCEELFREYYSDVRIATEDGSLGTRGFVTDLLAEALKSAKPDAVFACGPEPMYRALKAVDFGGAPVYVSLEQRMGCGMGGCAVCVCSIEGRNKKVCVDGPVFKLEEVDIHG